MPTQHDERERFVAFYFVEGFWAEQKPDYSHFGQPYWMTAEFTRLMEEQVLIVHRDNKKVVICRDGMVMYSDEGVQQGFPSHDQTFPRIEKYSEILNALFCIIASAVVERMNTRLFENFELTHHDIIPVTLENGGMSSMGIPQKSMLVSQLNKRFLSYTPSGYEDTLDMFIDMPPRRPLARDLLEEAIGNFLDIANDPKQTRLIARANKAAAEFNGTSFSDCLLYSWTEIEIYLFDKLKAFMATEGSTRFNADRRKHLQKELTASELLEVLEVAHVIDHNEYVNYNKLRKIRNKIIHEGARATFEEAGQSLTTLEKVINEVTGKSIKLNTGISMQMF